MAFNNLSKQYLPPVHHPPNDIPSKEECIYTKYFCEENVWLMAKKIEENSPEKLKFCYPVFISNENSCIPLWCQSASNQKDGVVLWDYHVIMVYSDEGGSWVYDYDSLLAFPTEFSKYCEETFKTLEFPESQLNPLYHRFFRVLSAEQFLKYFSSDRRHMKSEDGSWKKTPPSYPPIKNREVAHNLEKYTSMNEATRAECCGKFGQVLNLNSFIEKFSLFKRTSDIDYMFPPEPTTL